MSTAGSLLYLAASTLTGGAIGYVTNVVAVRMLFHPRRPRCLPRTRLCIAGLIPSRKKEIAERLAEAVARYALAGEAGRRLAESLSRRLAEALAGELEERLLTVPLLPRSMARAMAVGVAETLAPRLAAYVEKAYGNVDVAAIVREQLEALDEAEVEEVFRRVAGRELRAIELMGLAIGVVIGFIQGVVGILFLG